MIITLQDSPRKLKLEKMRLQYKKAKAEAAQFLSGSKGPKGPKDVSKVPKEQEAQAIVSSDSETTQLLQVSPREQKHPGPSKCRDQESQTTFSFVSFESLARSDKKGGNRFVNNVQRRPMSSGEESSLVDLRCRDDKQDVPVGRVERPQSYKLSIRDVEEASFLDTAFVTDLLAR